MSTLNVANITDGSTTVGTEYVVNGSAKAWVSFNGTGTVAVLDSLNVSSLTDNGTGQYRPNFTNVFAAGDYAVTAAKRDISSLADGHVNLVSQNASGSNIGTVEAGTYVDSTFVALSVHGDLA